MGGLRPDLELMLVPEPLRLVMTVHARITRASSIQTRRRCELRRHVDGQAAADAVGLRNLIVGTPMAPDSDRIRCRMGCAGSVHLRPEWSGMDQTVSELHR